MYDQMQVYGGIDKLKDVYLRIMRFSLQLSIHIAYLFNPFNTSLFKNS